MAQYSGMGLDYTFSACGDLGAYQYYFVKCASTLRRVDIANGASDPIALGVLQNDPYNGDLATVRLLGITKVFFSGSVAAEVGTLLSSGSGGAAEVSSGSAFYGISMNAIPAGTGYISMLLWPNVTLVAGTK